MKKRFNNLEFVIENNKILLESIGNIKTNGFRFVEVQLSGENKDSHMGIKMVKSSEGLKLDYVSFEHDDSTLFITQKSELIKVVSVFKQYKDTNAISVYNVIENISNSDIVIEEASSLMIYGFSNEGKSGYNDLYITKFISSHHVECQPKRFSFESLGLFNSRMETQKKICFSNIGSWSTKEEIPQCIIEDTSTNKMIMFEIESNNSWYYEISDNNNDYYLYTSGANSSYGNFEKLLKPNETYKTVTTSISFGESLNEIIENMTKYRRIIKGNSKEDEELPIIFNEYMHLSWDSPEENKTKDIANFISKLGSKYYVIDCGWHDEEPGYAIYPYVGKWVESKTRFSSGLRKTTDYIRSLGMKAGLWIEPEIIGNKCKEMLDYYDDSCFLQRNGKKVSVMNRYFLDFRSNKVRDYLNKTIERMVVEYGADYIKLDYNQDCGIGTDYNAFSCGDGLEQASKAYLSWIDEIRDAYPNVIFETCSSGGMRMDYETLKHFSIVSTSDQTNYSEYPYIASNVLSAVLPEQAAVWSYPVGTPSNPNEDFKINKEWVLKNISDEQVVINMINSFLGRMHLASDLRLLDDHRLELVKEGICYYNSLSKIKNKAFPYFPLGFSSYYDKHVSSGLIYNNMVYLAIWNLDGSYDFEIPMKRNIKNIKVGYPKNTSVKYGYNDNILNVKFNKKEQGLFLEIELM